MRITSSRFAQPNCHHTSRQLHLQKHVATWTSMSYWKTRDLAPRVEWQVPFPMLSTVEIARIDPRVKWGLGLGTHVEAALRTNAPSVQSMINVAAVTWSETIAANRANKRG